MILGDDFATWLQWMTEDRVLAQASLPSEYLQDIALWFVLGSLVGAVLDYDECFQGPIELGCLCLDAENFEKNGPEAGYLYYSVVRVTAHYDQLRMRKETSSVTLKALFMKTV